MSIPDDLIGPTRRPKLTSTSATQSDRESLKNDSPRCGMADHRFLAEFCFGGKFSVRRWENFPQVLIGTDPVTSTGLKCNACLETDSLHRADRNAILNSYTAGIVRDFVISLRKMSKD